MENQIIESKIIMELEKKILQGNSKAVEEFCYEIEVKGTPIIEKIDGDSENDLVTFIYRTDEEVENILLISPIGWHNLQECKMKRLLQTNLWYITYKVKNDIRLFYYFSVNDSMDNDWEKRFKKSKHDKYNNNATIFKGDNNEEDKYRSYALMSRTERDFWVNKRADIHKGILHEHQFHSDKFEKSRKIRIYTPYDYKKDNTPYGFLVLTDGDEHINILSAATVLDNLIEDKKIPPIVTIFIDSTETRREELMCNDNFGDIIVKEIIPWVRSKFNISNSAFKATIGGISLGGLTAAYLGLKHSEVFGNILSQSGSYWYDPDGYRGECWLGKQYEIIDKLPLKFYLSVGVLENKEQMIDTNNRLREILIDKGYTVDFEKFKSGHDYLCWGETFANGLISLIGIR
jgi:enterochelin esterase family protein